LRRTLLWVEELETRLVLSPVFAAVSTNWSGYAAQPLAASKATFSAVSGSWTVPTVTGSGTAYTSVWVGLDGYTSGTVEQIGTDSDLVNGVPTYYAWYEMYPSASVTVASITVNPGDTISASVTYGSGNSYKLSLTDGTQAFNTTQSLAGTKRSSAEWVVEAPSSNRGVLPLANFGTVSFSSAQATLTGATSSGPIDNSSWQNTAINMETSRGVPEANTGLLSDATSPSSFTVTYAGSSSPTPPTPPPSPAPPTRPTPPSPWSHHHGWGWGWASANEGPQWDVGSLAQSTTSVAPASAVFNAAQPTPVNFSTVAPPVVIPLNPASAPWLSLTGPAGAATDADADAEAMMLGAQAALTHDLFHPAAFALNTATPNAALQSAQPHRVAEPTRNDAVLISEAPAVSSAPPARQPEPRGSVVTKTMSRAFWLVAGLAFVSHRSFARGKRQTALRQDQNERS
jgi:hypothetical protein